MLTTAIWTDYQCNSDRNNKEELYTVAISCSAIIKVAHKLAGTEPSSEPFYMYLDSNPRVCAYSSAPSLPPSLPSLFPLGVAVPSLTSFAYYAFFLLLLILWSLHLLSKMEGFVRALRAIAILYCSLHLLLLHLYQFQSLQDHIPVQPANTTTSLLARLDTECQTI